MSEPAKDIYQAHLDRASQAIVAGDFETICAMMAYPLRVETVDAGIMVDGPDELLPSLRGYLANLEALGTRDFHRICRRAEFTGPAQDRIEGVHATYILSGAGPLLPPYENNMTLVLQDGQWLSAGLRASVSNTKGNLIRRVRV